MGRFVYNFRLSVLRVMFKLRTRNNFKFTSLFPQKITEYSTSSSSSSSSPPPSRPRPISIVPETSTTSVKYVPYIRRGSKKKNRKLSLASSENGNNVPTNNNFNSKNVTKYQNFLEKLFKPKDFVDLFSVYGNILARDEGKDKLLIRRPTEESKESESESEFNYPMDDNLMILLENSVRCWYSNSITRGKNMKTPAILSIQTPNRNFTWQLGKHLAAKSGNSNLALIPFSMFLELLETCFAGNRKKRFCSEEAKAFGDYILKNITSSSDDSKSKSHSKSVEIKLNKSISEEWASNFSKAVIQVFDYLFRCVETSLGGVVKKEISISSSMKSKGKENEKFTILLDGLEEYLLKRKGGETVLKNLINWAILSESSGRKIILGTRHSILIRNEDFNETEQEIDDDEEDFNDDNEESSKVINNYNSNDKKKMNKKIPNSEQVDPFLKLMTEIFLKLSSGGGLKNLLNEQNCSTNVLIDGNFLRVSANGPKNDKRKLLKYSQLIGNDRKKDLFDSNLMHLRSMALNQWNIYLKLESILSGKHEFPSSYPEIWEKLSKVGQGILIKKRLTSEEFSEIILYSLGVSSTSTSSFNSSSNSSSSSNSNNTQRLIDLEVLGEAIDNLSKIRHDPTKFSSDDLTNLLEEREIPINSLTKYEKRFINCISTSTTETKFKDISLPNGTVSTLKALTTLPLTHPELFTQGILKSSLTGVLLFGPPGTGKTMLARAVAEESGATFLAVNMSNILDMYVGEGEKNVQGLFSLARKLSPSIIFIDEIDSLLERRSLSSTSGRSSSRLEIVNEFMSQWDGLSSNLNCGVIVMGATNRPFVLDDAVLRRLPRRLLIDLPDPKNRQEILLKLLSENLCENDLIEGIPEFVHKMEFYSGSDLKNVAISAAFKSAVRLSSGNGSDFMTRTETKTTDLGSLDLIISKKDFEEALMEVPASLSDQMDSLVELRKWNQIYGESRDNSKQNIKFGFA